MTDDERINFVDGLVYAQRNHQWVDYFKILDHLIQKDPDYRAGVDRVMAKRIFTCKLDETARGFAQGRRGV